MFGSSFGRGGSCRSALRRDDPPSPWPARGYRGRYGCVSTLWNPVVISKESAEEFCRCLREADDFVGGLRIGDGLGPGLRAIGEPGRAAGEEIWTVEPSGRTVENPGRAVEMPGRAAELLGRALELPGRTVELLGRAVDLLGRAVGSSGRTARPGGPTVQISVFEGGEGGRTVSREASTVREGLRAVGEEG